MDGINDNNETDTEILLLSKSNLSTLKELSSKNFALLYNSDHQINRIAKYLKFHLGPELRHKNPSNNNRNKNPSSSLLRTALFANDRNIDIYISSKDENVYKKKGCIDLSSSDLRNILNEFKIDGSNAEFVENIKLIILFQMNDDLTKIILNLSPLR